MVVDYYKLKREVDMWELITKLFSGGKLLDSAKGIIDEVVTSKEEKAALYIKFQEMLTKHSEMVDSLEVADRESARQREIETSKTGSKNWTQNILAYVGVVGFFGIVGYMLSRGLGEMSAEESFIIGNMTGMAGAIAKDIFGYYFGSSKGEQDHKQIISDHFDWNKIKESEEYKKLMDLGKERKN
jgi:hypothetical protein